MVVATAGNEIVVSAYFSFGGNERNSLFFVVEIDVSAYFTLLELM